MVEFFKPETEYQVKRRQMLADQLRQQTAPRQTQMVGGIVIPESPLNAIADVVGSGVASYQDRKANELKTQDMESRRKFMADVLRDSGGDTSKLSQALMAEPSTTEMGLKLHMEALKNQNENANWERDANLKRELVNMKNKGGQPYIDENGEVVYPERKLSSTEQKEIFNTMDNVSSGNQAVTALTKAKNILTSSPAGSEPYTGFGAETRADIARIPVIGDIFADKERGAATTEYKNLVTEQALGSLKSIFGGMPTEGERKILLQMQALPEYTPQEQERIINNAIAAANNRSKTNEAKIQGIQTGSYKSPSAPKQSGGWTIEAVE
jgi:hypothetical protein